MPETNQGEEFGFNLKRRRARLASLGLTQADHKLALVLQNQVIGPHLDAIVDAFYDYLLKRSEFRKIIAHGFDIVHLKKTQTLYLLSLGVGFDQADYFEQRLRVGLAHVHAGVPLSLYQSAYCLLQQLIIGHFPDNWMADARKQRKMLGFVLKITALDMSLAIETYHLAQVHSLQKSIHTLRGKTAQLYRTANTDALTGIVNRKHVLAILKKDLIDARKDPSPLCIIMADLDLFKKINDTYGHLVGDSVLRGVTARIKSALRDFDVVGRYGGEEFLIVLKNTPRYLARQIAERVRRRVSESPLNIDGLEIPITISLGLVTMSAGDNMETLIRCADAALYEAKRSGRNRMIVFIHDERDNSGAVVHH
jgi:diguanylate cyclase (GGDEF)-like protein